MELQKAYDLIEHNEYTINTMQFSDLLNCYVEMKYKVFVDNPQALIKSLGLTDKIKSLSDDDLFSATNDLVDLVGDAINYWDVPYQLNGLVFTY